jgi:hypothetical protein
MTPEERELHERATKIRKMTDQQLCGYIDGLKNGNPEHISKIEKFGVNEFLLNLPNCKGIGQATIAKLREYARKEGYTS